MKKNNGILLAGSGVVFSLILSLFIPLWTTANERSDWETIPHNFFMCMANPDLNNVAGLIVFFGVVNIILSIIILILSFCGYNNKEVKGGMITCLVFAMLISFIQMIIGFVAPTTYSATTAAIPYGEVSFGPVAVTSIITLFLLLGNRGRVQTNQTPYTDYNSYYKKQETPAQNTGYNYKPIQQTQVNKPVAQTYSNTNNGIKFNRIEGAQRILTVYEDRVELEQMQNLRSILTSNYFDGTKTILFSSMTSIQYKRPSDLILGYIQFEVPGTFNANNFNSENSWTFEKSQEEIARQIVEYCRSRIGKANQPVHQTQIIQEESSLDKLKKLKELCDMGAITPEEYEEKKKDLLSKM